MDEKHYTPDVRELVYHHGGKILEELPHRGETPKTHPDLEEHPEYNPER